MATVKIGDRLQPYGVTLVSSRTVNRDFKAQWFATRAAELGIQFSPSVQGRPYWPLEYEGLAIDKVLDQVQAEWDEFWPGTYVVPFGYGERSRWEL